MVVPHGSGRAGTGHDVPSMLTIVSKVKIHPQVAASSASGAFQLLHVHSL